MWKVCWSVREGGGRCEERYGGCGKVCWGEAREDVGRGVGGAEKCWGKVRDAKRV